jgi:HD-like signal output (HDOD) protein
MDIQTAIARKQLEADNLDASIAEAQIDLAEKREVITRLQELNAQPAFSLEDINYLIQHAL